MWVEGTGEERNGGERADNDDEEEEGGTSLGRESGIVASIGGIDVVLM